MADIKLTLSKDTKYYSPSADEEANWLKQEGVLYYPLNKRPTKAASGCWVYIIRDGQLVARAKAVDFVDSLTLKTKRHHLMYTYTGQSKRTAQWNVACTDIELASKPVVHAGFQGFRYVKPNE